MNEAANEVREVIRDVGRLHEFVQSEYCVGSRLKGHAAGCRRSTNPELPMLEPVVDAVTLEANVAADEDVRRMRSFSRKSANKGC
jgi:hypothetical protein